MAPIPRKRSLADMQHTECNSNSNGNSTAPAEYNDNDYFREVLQLDDETSEALFDEHLLQQASKLGITISRPPTPTPKNAAHNSMCESAITVASHHARTASTGSQESGSTGMTSRSSNEQLDNLAPPQARRRPNSRRSLSFSEYEKYLMQAEQEADAKTGFLSPPMPAELAPSLFSVSTRRSYVSIKNGLKNRFKLSRNKASQDGLK
jgi:hypothetical protein